MRLINFNWRSLQTKVIVFTLTIFLIGIWSLSIYARSALHENMQRILGEQQFSTVSFVAAEVNEQLGDRMKALEKIASEITPAMLANHTKIQALLENRPLLLQMFNAGIFVIGMDGTAIADTPLTSGRVGINYLDRDFIVTTLREGKAIINRPLFGKILKAPILPMSVPIKNAQGKVVGALVGTTNLGLPNFLDKITDNKYGKNGGYVLLIPEHRLIVTATDKSRIMTPVPAAGVIPTLDRFLQGYEGSAVYVNPLGIEVLGSAKQIPVANWLMGITLPTKEAFAPIVDMQQRMFLATLLLTLLAAGLSWWIGSWILKQQLSPLLAASRNLDLQSASNQPPQPLPVTTQDEIGELISGFNRMLLSLGQREQALSESEAATAESKNLLMTIIDTLPLRVFWKDAQLNYLGCNIAFAKDAGVKDSADICGKNDFHLSWAEQAENYRADDRAVIDSGIAKLFYEEQITTPDGATLWLRTSKVPLRNHEQKIVGVLGIYEDYTDHKNVEQDAHTLREQLTQATKMEAVGHLTAGIAHDFNNILGAIMGYTELSKHVISPDNPAASTESLARYLDEVLNASHRAKELIAQMLTFSRLQTDSNDLEAPPILLTPVVKEVVSLLRSSIPSTIELNYDIQAADLMASIHPVQLHQIILNLGINARDAIGEYGQINLTLSRQQMDSVLCASCRHPFSGEFCKLTVSDSGSGIDNHILNNIFTPFFTTKGVGKGTGMGLSVVHGLVHALGGHIQVVSKPGRGTEISILLPCAISPAIESKGKPPVENNSHSLNGIRIMLVDDERAMTAMLQEFLKEQGAAVTSYNSPTEAMRAFEQHPDSVDIVITDETMPELSGMHLAELMLRFRPQLPIILCTGYSEHATPELAHQLGLADFIYKPFKVKELSRKIYAAIAKD